MRTVPYRAGSLNAKRALLRTRADQDWSLTNCISFVVMDRNELHEALTGDQHFEPADFNGILE